MYTIKEPKKPTCTLNSHIYIRVCVCVCTHPTHAQTLLYSFNFPPFALTVSLVRVSLTMPSGKVHSCPMTFHLSPPQVNVLILMLKIIIISVNQVSLQSLDCLVFHYNKNSLFVNVNKIQGPSPLEL